MVSSFETTLAGKVELFGHGVHSGKPATLFLHPAPAGSGYQLLRTDAEAYSEAFPAVYSGVRATELCTVVGLREDAQVSTVEHLLAALRAMGVDNVLIEIDGPEMVIMDGSSIDFVNAFDAVGLVPLTALRRHVRVLKPVEIAIGESRAALLPYDGGFRVDVTIDFAHPVIGRQSIILDVTPATFRHELARARTFGFFKDVEPLRARGLALGSSFENTVVVGDDGVLNPEPHGLRWNDEFVRHKTLDAIGDLALAGMPILGAYQAYRSGHRLNVAILEALFADASAYVVEPVQSASGVSAAQGSFDIRTPQRLLA
jgi:UDP-3-O-[3-hydroxymyristoyl] N-acetylglucosamine deacetylase